MPQGEGDIILFDGGLGGYGWATDQLQHGYHWAINMDCRNGRADLVAGPTRVRAKSLQVRPGVILDWADGNDIPEVLIPHGLAGSSIVTLFQDDTTADEAIADDSAPLLGGAIYRHNASDEDVEMAFFCSGTSGDEIISRTDAASYTTDTASGATADLLAVIGPDLWRVIDGYKMEKLTLNNNPLVEANWSGVRIHVGVPSNPINKVLEFGGSPVCLTGAGIYTYNVAPTTARFENRTPFVRAHPENGRGGFADGRGRIYYPTHSGRILVFSFNSLSQQGPLRFQEIDRDTPYGRIQEMTADEEFVYAAVDPGFVKTQQLGISVQIFNESFASPDPTTVLTDGKGTTNADVSALSDVDDYIYIGADEPFWGVYFEMHTPSAITTAGGWSASYSAGSDTWIAFTEKDSTMILHESGAITFDTVADVYAGGTWLRQDVNSVTNKYWIRLAPSSVTLTSAKIGEAYVIPYRPSYDTSTFPDTGAALAGAMPKILVGQWRGQNIIWHDWLTLQSEGKVLGMTVSRTTTAESVGEQTLYLMTSTAIMAVPVGPDALPARAAWPKTNGIPHAIGFSGNNFGSPVNVKSVQKLVVHGGFLQADDNLVVAYRWDQGDRWYTSDQHSQFPVVLETLEGQGRELHVAVQLSDGSIDAHSPYITHAIVPEGSWTDHGPLHENLGSDFVAPQAI